MIRDHHEIVREHICGFSSIISPYQGTLGISVLSFISFILFTSRFHNGDPSMHHLQHSAFNYAFLVRIKVSCASQVLAPPCLGLVWGVPRHGYNGWSFCGQMSIDARWDKSLTRLRTWLCHTKSLPQTMVFPCRKGGGKNYNPQHW